MNVLNIHFIVVKVCGIMHGHVIRSDDKME